MRFLLCADTRIGVKMMSKTGKKAIGMTALVVFLLLLAGLLRLVMVNSENYLINIACTLLVFTIYIGMLFVWSMSIWRRVMHTDRKSVV